MAATPQGTAIPGRFPELANSILDKIKMIQEKTYEGDGFFFFGFTLTRQILSFP